MAEAAPRERPPEAGETEGDDAERLDPGTLLTAAALLLAAFPVVAVGFSDRPGPYLVQTYLFWSDLPLFALGLLRLPDLARRVAARRLDLVTALVALVVALTVAWAVHPSLRGGLQVLRFVGVAGAVLSVSRSGDIGRRLLTGALAAFTVVQVVLAVAQKASGGPIGLGSLGELAEPLVPIGGSNAPEGTLIHPYLLAGLAIVTMAVLAAAAIRVPRHLAPCTAVVTVAGVAVGMTYSRTAVLALVGLVVGLVLALSSSSTRRSALVVLAAVLLGVGATALVASDGWVGRAEETSSGTNVTRGRGELVDQALALIRRHPLVGVGTGRYVLAVEADKEVAAKSSRLLQPVHVVPLLFIAEGGVLAAAAMVLLGIALVGAAVRGGIAGWGLLLAYTPFLLLDHFPATYPQGLVITAAWLAALQVLGSGPAPEVRSQEVAAARPGRP